MKKNKQKIDWKFYLKSFLIIFAFVAASMVLLYGSGTIDRLSNSFYVEQYGEVAGDFSVKISSTLVSPSLVAGADQLAAVKQYIQGGLNPWKKQYDAAMTQVTAYTEGPSDDYWKTTDDWATIKSKTDSASRSSGKSVKLYLMCYLSNDVAVCDKARDWITRWTSQETLNVLRTYNQNEIHALNSMVIATGLGFDWIYAKLNQTEKDQVNNWLKTAVDYIKSRHEENGSRAYHNKHAWDDVTMVVAGLSIKPANTAEEAKYKNIVKYAIADARPESKSLVVLANNGMIKDSGQVCDSNGGYGCTELAHNLLSLEAFWLSYSVAKENGSEYVALFDPIKTKLFKTLDFYAPLYKTGDLTSIGQAFADDTRNFDNANPNYKPWTNFSSIYEIGYKYLRTDLIKQVLESSNFNDGTFNQGIPRYCNTSKSYGRCARWTESISVLIWGQELGSALPPPPPPPPPPPATNTCVGNLRGIICQPNQTCPSGWLVEAIDTNYCCATSCIGGCSTGYSYCQLGKICQGVWYYNIQTSECCSGSCANVPKLSTFPLPLATYLNTDKAKYDLNIGTGDNQVDLFINYNTSLKDNALAPLNQIVITPASPIPAAPANEKVIKAYNFGLDGAQFDPPIKLVFNYTNSEIAGVTESGLYIGLWENNQWKKQTTSLDQANNKAEAQISHFSVYGLLGALLCGNGACDTGENSVNCPADCPPTPPPANCGNGTCDAGEDSINCPADCPSGPGGSGDLIKIDDNARNPAVVVDSMGNLHVAYDCDSAGGVCYRKIYQEMGQIKKGPVIPLASGTSDPRIEITDGDQIHIVTGAKYIVIEPDGTIIKKDLSTLNSPRLALSAKNPGEAYVLYRETDRYGAIKMKKIKASGGTISEEATITVNNKCSKPQMPGNVVVDKDDVVHLTWRQYGDSDPICPGRNVQYIQYKNNSFVNKKQVFDATSDYTDLELNEDTGEFHMIATTPYGSCGLAYRTMDMGGNLSPIYYLYLPYGVTYACTKPAGETASYIISGAADRRGEANITAPYMSFENDGKLHIAFIGAGTQIRPDTIEDALKNVYWEVDNIDPDSMPVPNSSDLEQLKARWLSKNSGKTTNDYIEMLNEEIFCWNNPASYLSAKGCYYYTAYHTVLDKATLKPDTPPGGDAPNNIPTPEKFTPERTKESDQGSDASNPIIDKAWNQGVFMVFEDDYENPKFNIYLKAVGGAVIGIPQMKADLNCSGKVDVVDLGILMSCWGNNYDQYSPQSCALGANIKAACKRPINIDGLTGSDGKETIDISDFSIMMGCWGVNNSPQCFAVIGP